MLSLFLGLNIVIPRYGPLFVAGVSSLRTSNLLLFAQHSPFLYLCNYFVIMKIPNILFDVVKYVVYAM